LVNNRRSEFDIIRQILKLTREGAKKTEILYQSNMSYIQLQNYLFYLIDKNILEEQIVKENGGMRKIYRNTDKGSNLLTDINKTLSYFQ